MMEFKKYSSIDNMVEAAFMTPAYQNGLAS